MHLTDYLYCRLSHNLKNVLYLHSIIIPPTHLYLMLEVNKLLLGKSNFEQHKFLSDLIHYICSGS